MTLSLLENSGRNDEYADQFLFCEQILQRTQELCGKDYPLIPRLCCDENYVDGFDLDYFDLVSSREFVPLHARAAAAAIVAAARLGRTRLIDNVEL